MRKLLIAASVMTAAVSLFAQGRRDPVAEGYPDWSGVIDKNRLSGRLLCPSDLRHKFVIVVEIDPKDEATAKKQLLAAADFAKLNFYQSSHFGVSWETHELPRDPQVLVSNFGIDEWDVLNKAMKSDDKAETVAFSALRGSRTPFYNEVTFEGAPDGAGKRPFVYLLGPAGSEVLASGPADRATLAAVRKAMAKAKSKLKSDGWSWRPFYGSVAEPQFYKNLEKTLTSRRPKPLTADMAKIKRKIASRKPEEAKEAQILYDALEQTRSDLVFRIQAEAAACPHRAAYDIQRLLRYWPNEKKRIADYADKIKEVPEFGQLAKIFVKMMEWGDPEFTPRNAGEAKKIVAELTKMKKQLEKLKESKIVVVQNGASLIDAEMDGLISSIPSKVPEK